jgi:hypothetical protein
MFFIGGRKIAIALISSHPAAAMMDHDRSAVYSLVPEALTQTAIDDLRVFHGSKE